MATKRAKKGLSGKYHGISKQPDGRWTCFVELPRGPGGVRKRKKIAHREIDEVVRLRNEATVKIDKGQELPPVRVTVDDIVQAWLANRQDVAKSTRDNYNSIIRNHITRTTLGRKRASAVRKEDVNNHLAWMEEKGLSARSRRLARVIIRGALGRGPAGRACVSQRGQADEGPAHGRRQPWLGRQARLFVQWVHGDCCRSAVVVAGGTNPPRMDS
jgi:hypothetical protein